MVGNHECNTERGFKNQLYIELGHWHFQCVISTYLPRLVNVVCERPLIAVYAGKLLPHTSWVCRYSAALICHDYQVVKTFARLTTQGWRSTDHLPKLKQHYLLTNFFSKLKTAGTRAGGENELIHEIQNPTFFHTNKVKKCCTIKIMWYLYISFLYEI